MNPEPTVDPGKPRGILGRIDDACSHVALWMTALALFFLYFLVVNAVVQKEVSLWNAVFGIAGVLVFLVFVEILRHRELRQSFFQTPLVKGVKSFLSTTRSLFGALALWGLIRVEAEVYAEKKYDELWPHILEFFKKIMIG